MFSVDPSDCSAAMRAGAAVAPSLRVQAGQVVVNFNDEG